jgi:hypothetical protein
MNCFQRYTVMPQPSTPCLFCGITTSNSAVIWIGHKSGVPAYLDVVIHYDGRCYERFRKFTELVKLYYPTYEEISEDTTLDTVLKKINFAKFCENSKL